MTSSVVASPCPMCGDLLTVHLASKIVLGKKYNLEKCTRCGQHYCDPTPTPEEMQGFYHGGFHQELRSNGATERVFGKKLTRYRDWVINFVSGGRSVDLGTSTGLFPSMLKDAGFDAEGVEYNSQSAEWGASHYGIRIRVGGVEQIASELATYDFISMTDVLEHTEHPFRVLQMVSRSLKPRSHMLITFPDIESFESRYQRGLARVTGRSWIWSCCNVPLHVWEFTPATARAMFDRAGFDVVGFRRSQVLPDSVPGIAGLLLSPLNALVIPMLSRSIGTQMEFMLRSRS